MSKSAHQNTVHENPGIASIWRDEIARRNQMSIPCDPPELPPDEKRPAAKPTESDVFFRQALAARLDQQANSQGGVITPTTEQSAIFDATVPPNETKIVPPQTKRTFNLKQLLSNSVYPAEWSSSNGSGGGESQPHNASHILNHTKSQDIFSSFNDGGGGGGSDRSLSISTWMLDETIIDEDVICSLSETLSGTANETCKLASKCPLSYQNKCV